MGSLDHGDDRPCGFCVRPKPLRTRGRSVRGRRRYAAWPQGAAKVLDAPSSALGLKHLGDYLAQPELLDLAARGHRQCVYQLQALGPEGR